MITLTAITAINIDAQSICAHSSSLTLVHICYNKSNIWHSVKTVKEILDPVTYNEKELLDFIVEKLSQHLMNS